MTPPAAGFTSDENQNGPAPLSLSWLAAAKRWLATLGLIVLLGAAAALAGYCYGRASVPRLTLPPALVDTIRATDTIYQHDTRTLVQTRTRYDTARVTDTLWRDSVVYVRREAADSLAAACSLVLRDCGTIRAQRDSLLTLATRAAVPVCPDHRLALVVGYGAQAEGGRVTHGWQATAGVRVWSPPWP